jgi:hypothetical protein
VRKVKVAQRFPALDFSQSPVEFSNPHPASIGFLQSKNRHHKGFNVSAIWLEEVSDDLAFSPSISSMLKPS